MPEYKKISELETVSGELTARSYIPVVHGGTTYKFPFTQILEQQKIYSGVVNLPASGWKSSNHLITVDVEGVTANTTQIIMPMLATSAANIANNAALQEANIQDAGQSSGKITLYAETIPSVDLYIRVIVYV